MDAQIYSFLEQRNERERRLLLRITENVKAMELISLQGFYYVTGESNILSGVEHSYFAGDYNRGAQTNSLIERSKELHSLQLDKIFDYQKNGVCIKCNNKITGVIKQLHKDTNVFPIEYLFLEIYSKTGMCISCICEFLLSSIEKWGENETNYSNFNFTMQPPVFANDSIAKIAKELTLSEEEQLKETSIRVRSNILERQQRVRQQVAKNRETTSSDVLAFTVCSACGFPLESIKNDTTNNLSSGSISSGLLCSNVKCLFYLKLIPVNKVPELTNVAFIPQITFATENYLKEHPEERRK